MGNVIANDPPIPKRAATTHHTVFNMRHAVILSDTVDAKLARAFLIQARDPAFEGHWSAHIQKTALRLIKLRLMDEFQRMRYLSGLTDLQLLQEKHWNFP
jgi:hypothetical protein